MKTKDTLIYIVAHNHINFLDDCLESVFNHLDDSTDVILIDSGSTDGSRDYLERYSKTKNSHFHDKKLILTEIIDWVYINFTDKYDFIMRIDADDILMPGALSTLKSKIKDDKNCGSVSGSWIEIDAYSRTLNKMILENGHAKAAFHGACTLFRSEAVKNIRFQNHDIKSQDGLYTWLKISKKWNCKTIDKFIFQYRRHDNNLSNQEEKLFLGRRRAYESIFNEENLELNACVVIGYNDNELISSYKSKNKNFIQIFEEQLQQLENCESVKSIYLSSNSDLFDSISINKFPKLVILKREKSSETLVHSLQKCPVIKEILNRYDDVFLLNPVKNSWNSDFISTAIYSKHIHSYKTIIACKLIKGSVFNEEEGQLKYVNFSDLNTVFTSKFLFIRLPGFLLVGSEDFYKISNNFPEPIGHISNNFLTLGINSL